MQVGAIYGNAGAGATVDLDGSDCYGSFQLNTGTSSAGGIQFELTLDAPTDPQKFGGHVGFQLKGLDAPSIALGLTMSPVTDVIISGLLVGVNFVAWGTIVDSTSYRFAYRIL